MKTVYYNEYLKVPELKECVKPITKAHDEHLFIITHQAYELWFKQILFELDNVIPKLNKPFPDNGPVIFVINHRLNRIVEIWKVLVQQFAILETMTPLDFLDFRGELSKASGFQSLQFKEIEATLGLKSATRFHPPDKKNEVTGEIIKSNKDYYKVLGKADGGFEDFDRAQIEKRENSPTLLDAIKSWLTRMPFFDDEELWKDYSLDETLWNSYANGSNQKESVITHPFWRKYVLAYYNSLSPDDREKAKDKELIDVIENGNYSYSAVEVKAALFIMSYRAFPIFHLPFQLLTNVIEIDEMISDWRYRHLNVVMRMIGSRSGTKGDASGAEYLKGIVEKNYIFKNLSSLVTYLIPRKTLPELPKKLIEKIGYGID